MAVKDLFLKLFGHVEVYGKRSTQSKDSFERERSAQMEEAYDKLYRVNNQEIRYIDPWQHSETTDVCTSSAHELVCDWEPISVVDDLSNFEEARLEFKKYRNYHCTFFANVIMMTLSCIDSIIREVVGSFNGPNNMQDMNASQNVQGQESEVEGSLTPYKKYSSRKGEVSFAIFATVS